MESEKSIIDYHKLIINIDNSTNSLIPYEHQYYIHAFILSELEKINPKLSSELYHSKIPYFVMSQLIPGENAIFKKEGFFCKRLVLFINSADMSLLEFLKVIFAADKNILLNGLKLHVHSSYISNPPVDEIVPELVTRSPIILKDNNRYVAYGDDDFYKVLKNSLSNKLSKIFDRDIQIRGINVTYGKRKLYHIHNSPIVCSMIKFVIDVDSDALKALLCFGIGKNTRLGFGMVDLHD